MKFCLIGEKLSHSYSKIIHNKCGIDYSLNSIEKDRLKDFLLSNDYNGFNVTIPYKKEVIQYLDFVDDTSKEIGAVNTVKKVNGKLYGFNTDIYGLEYLFNSANINVNNKNVVILGSGGASNCARYFATQRNAKSVTIVGRNGLYNYQNIYSLTDTEIIINATPVGMYPNNLQRLIELDKFSKLEGVVDLIYNPFLTDLLLQAKKLKIKHANGLGMLVAQAIKSQEIWLDKKVENSFIDSIVNNLISEKQNIVLIGMPSAGKTTIGKILAEKLNKKLVDLDQEILSLTGKSPSEIIIESGEKTFREIESKVVLDFSKQNGLVIATGGGAVLREENRDGLCQNGKIVYIKRDIDKLVVDNRPISKDKGIEKLYLERKDIYNSFADIVVENNYSIEKCVKEIIEKL